MSRLLRALDRHWFAPARAVDLARLRVALVAVQLVLLLSPAPLDPSPAACLRFQLWLTRLPAEDFHALPLLKLFLLPLGWGARPPAALLLGAWLAAVLGGALALVGVRARAGGLALAAANSFLVAHAYSYGEGHHTEAVASIVLWALALGPSDRAWSLDDLCARLRAAASLRFQPLREREDAFARWPLRLTQWLLGLTYFSAALCKFEMGGLGWFDGHTLAYYFARDAIERQIPLGIWLAGYPLQIAPLAIAAWLFESTFALALLSYRATALYAIGGLGLHLGIWAVHGPPFAQTLVLYLAFAEPLRRALAPWRAQAGRPWTIVYDGRCPPCLRTLVALDYLDLGGRLRHVDLESGAGARAAPLPAGISLAEARRRMHVVAPDGGVHAGFAALRALARALPALWPLLPLLHAPLAGALGPRLYARIARRRARRDCASGACGVHSLEH